MASFIEKTRKIIEDHKDAFDALEEYDKTHVLRRLNYKERVNFTLDSKEFIKFRSHCIKNSVSMSGKVNQLIKEYMEKQ